MARTDEKPLDIVRLNIARYMRLLESETDPMTLTTLRTLLAEARNEETLIEAEAVFEKGKKQPVELREDARRWRMRAEEYRTVAGAIASEAARSTYRRLARSYEGLAEPSAGRADNRRIRHSAPQTKSGYAFANGALRQRKCAQWLRR